VIELIDFWRFCSMGLYWEFVAWWLRRISSQSTRIGQINQKNHRSGRSAACYKGDQWRL